MCVCVQVYVYLCLHIGNKAFLVIEVQRPTAIWAFLRGEN